MTVPEELHYTPEHEWVAITGSTASVGITDHAQNALGDVVYVSVPAPGSKVTAGEPCGEVESTKSVSDLYSPVDGEVTEVNPEIEENPGLINSDPYGAGRPGARRRRRAGRPAVRRRVRRPHQGGCGRYMSERQGPAPT
jgi:glycine cleavage system H protein